MILLLKKIKKIHFTAWNSMKIPKKYSVWFYHEVEKCPIRRLEKMPLKNERFKAKKKKNYFRKLKTEILKLKNDIFLFKEKLKIIYSFWKDKLSKSLSNLSLTIINYLSNNWLPSRIFDCSWWIHGYIRGDIIIYWSYINIYK